ncbi:MAG: hypothetical protein Q8K75_11850 [Chlamydiales bacterium]|nr:hypothetical protein [Chlamydiales bacterium]
MDVRPLNISFQVAKGQMPRHDFKSAPTDNQDVLVFATSLKPSSASGQNLQGREICVFSKGNERILAHAEGGVTSSLRHSAVAISQPLVGAAVQTCLGIPISTLKPLLDIKISRSTSLALLMILLPWKSGCPTALGTTVLQGSMGCGGHGALHSSQQPGVALHLQKAPMAEMLQDLLLQMVHSQLSTLQNYLQAGGEDKNISDLCNAAFLFDLVSTFSILDFNNAPSKLLQTLQNAGDFQHLLQRQITDHYENAKFNNMAFEEIAPPAMDEQFLSAYVDSLQNLIAEVPSITSTSIAFEEGENLLASRLIELSHAAADVLPQELNRLDADAIERWARPRLEVLQHRSGLGKTTPQELCDQYLTDLSDLLAKTTDYTQRVCQDLDSIIQEQDIWRTHLDTLLRASSGALDSPQNFAAFKQAFLDCYASAVQLAKYGNLFNSYRPDAEEVKEISTQVNENTFHHVSNRMTNGGSYVPIKDMPHFSYGLTEVAKYGSLLMKMVYPTVDSAVKAVLMSAPKVNSAPGGRKRSAPKGGDLSPNEKIFNELMAVPNETRDYLESRVPFLSLNLDGKDEQRLHSLAKSWITDLEYNTSVTIFSYELHKIDYSTLKQSLKVARSTPDAASVTHLLKQMCQYLQDPTRPNVKAMTLPIARVFENALKEDLGPITALFDTAAHNVAFENTSYTSGRPPINGSSTLSINNPLEAQFRPLLAKKAPATIEELHNMLHAISLLPDSDITPELSYWQMRITLAIYLTEAFNAVLLNDSISHSKKNAIRNFLSTQLNWSNIQTGAFLTHAIRLIEAKRGDPARIATDFAVLIELCESCQSASDAVTRAFAAPEVQDALDNAFEAENIESHAPTKERAYLLRDMLLDFNQHVLPVYSASLANITPPDQGSEGALKTLLTSEIDRSATPTKIKKVIFSSTRSLDLPILAQYAFLQTLSRGYERVYSQRPLPALYKVIPHQATTIVNGQLSLDSSDEKKISLNFSLTPQILTTLNSSRELSRDEKQTISSAPKISIDGGELPLDQIITKQLADKIQYLAQCLVWDILDVSTGDYNLTFILQQFQRATRA